MSAPATVFNIPSNSTFNQETAHAAFTNLTDIITETVFDPNNLAKNIKFIISQQTEASLTKVIVDLGTAVHDNTDSEEQFEAFSTLVSYNIPQLIAMMKDCSELAKPFGWEIDQDKVFLSLYNTHQFAGVGWNSVTKRKDAPKYGQGQYQLVIGLKPYLSVNGGKDGRALAPRCNNTPKEGTPFVVSTMCPAFEAAPTAVRRARGRAQQMDEDGKPVVQMLANKPLPVIPSSALLLQSNAATVTEMMEHVAANAFSTHNFASNILWAELEGKCTSELHFSFERLIKEKIFNVLRAHNLECCLSTDQNDKGKWVATPPEINLVKDLTAAYSTQYAASFPAFVEMMTDRAPTLLRENGWSMRGTPKIMVYDEKAFRGFAYSEDGGPREKLFGASSFKVCILIAPLEGVPAWEKSGPICCNKAKEYDSPHILGSDKGAEDAAPEAPVTRAPPGTSPYRDRALLGASRPSAAAPAAEHLRDGTGQRFVPFASSSRSAAGGGRAAPSEEGEFVSQGGRSNRGGASSSSEIETLRRRLAELEGGGGGGGRSYAGGGGGGGATGRR